MKKNIGKNLIFQMNIRIIPTVAIYPDKNKDDSNKAEIKIAFER
jgi:hypothetical protein